MSFIKKSIFLLTAVLLSFGLAACDKKSEETDTDKAISQYIQFQKELGVKDKKEQIASIHDIFADDVVKITDGHTVAKGHDALDNHWLELRNRYGSWHIIIKEQSLSPDQKSATLKYSIATEKAGSFEVVTILTLSDDYKIKEISELYYQTEFEQDE
jgi:hypothetical protein